MKTIKDISYWGKVCEICGKAFESKLLKQQHVRRHSLPRQDCDICGTSFSSKLNLHRHMNEQHNAMQNVGTDESLNVINARKSLHLKAPLRGIFKASTN